jgi:hypothetical protein
VWLARCSRGWGAKRTFCGDLNECRYGQIERGAEDGGGAAAVVRFVHEMCGVRMI